MNFIPDDLKEFKDLLNPTNLSCFNAKEIFSEFLKSRKSVSDAISQDQNERDNAGLEENEYDKYHFILRTYFSQIFFSKKISLDLRSHNVVYENGWKYLGSSINYQFDHEFQSALQEVYRKFFSQKDESIIPELQRLGLVQSHWSDEVKSEFEELFFKHFYSEDVESMTFDMKQMFSSFTKIFLYLKDKGVVVPTPFAFLGLYLATLYFTLSSSSTPFNLKEEYLKATK